MRSPTVWLALQSCTAEHRQLTAEVSEIRRRLRCCQMRSEWVSGPVQMALEGREELAAAA